MMHSEILSKSRANEIVSYAEKSVGLTDGTDAGREAVKWCGGLPRVSLRLPWAMEVIGLSARLD